MLRIAVWTRVVGGEKAWRAEEIVHLAQIGRPAEDVIVGLEGVVAETVAEAQASPCARHDLHQTHGPGGGDGGHPTRTFHLHHRPDPVLWNTETLRRFGDMVGMRMRG